MTEMSHDDIRTVVLEALAEQQRVHHSDIDAVVFRAIATILTSFGIEEEDRRELRADFQHLRRGIEEEDRRELRADFQHLRRWRKSVEQAQSYTFKTVITIIVAGFLGAIWLGIKVMVGK